MAEDRCRIIVTGSARLDVLRRGGDSLMGRYLLYRMHPLSVAELATPTLPAHALRPPLLRFGGFPEPLPTRTFLSQLW